MKIENGYLVGLTLIFSDNEQEVERLCIMRPVDAAVEEYYRTPEVMGGAAYLEVAIPSVNTITVLQGYENHIEVKPFDGQEFVLLGRIDDFLDAVKEYEEGE